MKRSRIILWADAGLVVVWWTGCTSKKSTTGDLMKAHGTEVKAQADLKTSLAKDWEKRAEMVKSGEKRIKKANQNIERARRDSERGDRDIREGHRLMQESERKFREAFPDLNITPGK